MGRLLDGVPGPRQIGATILAGLVALAVAAPAATGSGRRRVAMVVRDRHEGLSQLPGHGATDVVVGGFQFDVNTTYPNYGDPDTNDYVNGFNPVLMLDAFDLCPCS